MKRLPTPLSIPSQSTTVYLGKLYEKVTTAGASEHKHYLYAANTLVGIHTHKPDNTTNTRYVHTDHLLSVDTVTDEAGNVVSRLSYDAHGKRRNVNGLDATTPITAQTTRGFTRHEMDDELGLINMNAREYDPILGRFLTPDTFVQYPASTQGYNRYTYVNNNPLSFTDPSGHFLKSIFRAVKSVVNEVKRAASSDLGRVAIAVAGIYWAASGGLDAFAKSIASTKGGIAVVKGVVGGGIIGFVATGDVQGAAYGAISGAMFAQIGNWADAGGWQWYTRAGAHALGGGAMSRLQGGSFRSGAMAAGFASLAGNVPAFNNLVARAVIGGVSAEIGGGKFSNGALTATYAYLYNDSLHPEGHEYKYRSHICNMSAAGCTPENVFQGQLRNTYPGQPAGEVVTHGGRYSVHGMEEWGAIRVSIDYDNLSITNITESTHFFCCGSVTRSVIVDQGSIYVQTHGVGSNPSLFNATLNYAAGYFGFIGNTRGIRAYVREQGQ
jgi:RHS repeat-associated protein